MNQVGDIKLHQTLLLEQTCSCCHGMPWRSLGPRAFVWSQMVGIATLKLLASVTVLSCCIFPFVPRFLLDSFFVAQPLLTNIDKYWPLQNIIEPLYTIITQYERCYFQHTKKQNPLDGQNNREKTFCKFCCSPQNTKNYNNMAVLPEMVDGRNCRKPP